MDGWRLRAAQGLQRFHGQGAIHPAGLDHETPVRGDKGVSPARGGLRTVVWPQGDPGGVNRKSVRAELKPT
jgi:hypothetical protein